MVLITFNSLLLVGLYTANEASFSPNASTSDLVSPGVHNIWICEVGSQTLNGTFEEFMTTLTDSTVNNIHVFNLKFGTQVNLN